MVEVVERFVEVAPHRAGRGATAHPSRYDHPGVERKADYRSSFNQYSQLFVAELAVMRDDAPAIIMAGPHMPLKVPHGLPESVVAQMRGVEYDAEPLHFFQQRQTGGAHFPGRIGAVGIAARSVMRRPDRPQSVFPGALQML